MPTLRNHTHGQRRLLTLAVLMTLASFGAAQAAPVSYIAVLDGASEAVPNASPGTGLATVDIDAAAHTMTIHAMFSGLQGTTTAAHIHAATAVAGTGTAGVATTTPTFPGFPSGVSSGVYDVTLDMTLASSYNASYVTANGGTIAGAEAALFQSIADGKAYFNIHSSMYGGGEIRGFLVPATVATTTTTWGQVKSLFR